MDIKKYLREQITGCKRKLNLARMIDFCIVCAAAGGIPAMACEMASLVWPFYYVHLAAGACFAAGLLVGLCYAACRRVSMEQAAGRLDSFGLKERMLTAYEQMEKETEFAQMQRQDALLCYERVRKQIKIPIMPDKRHILAFVLSVAAVIVIGILPSQVRDQARIRHLVQEKAEEEQDDLEKLIEALESVEQNRLTEEQREQLRELAEALQLSKEELAGANSWESLASATERLDYKYDQAMQSLQNLAAQLENPAAAGIASAEALAQALANQNGQQTASTQGTPSGGGSGDGSGNEDGGGTGGGDPEGGDGSGENSGNGESGNNQNGDGSEQGSGDGSGSGNGDGSGQGQGSGNGNGNGDGSGQGSGSGSGSGNGRGTGSSDKVHDYVSIPNAVADDPSLSGNKNGDQNSDYYRQQNGLAWEGEHVDYNSVIGEYADSAYEGIANGRYPSGMESVIRDYFGNLNN